MLIRYYAQRPDSLVRRRRPPECAQDAIAASSEARLFGIGFIGWRSRDRRIRCSQFVGIPSCHLLSDSIATIVRRYRIECTPVQKDSLESFAVVRKRFQPGDHHLATRCHFVSETVLNGVPSPLQRGKE